MRSVTPEQTNLGPLEHAYDVMAELGGRQDARQLLATRRSDGSQVVISIFHAPEGDQGNALSHLAADVNRLIELRHPNLVPVLEGQWVGPDAYAVVTPRIGRQTLEEMLARRHEDFSYARIALILREVNGVVEWARAHKFVHRAVELDTVYVEDGSDDVQVAFAVRALPRTGMPGAADDARTIATIARAMLTRSPAAPERDEQPLAELRPGLPTVVVQQTEALLTAHERHGKGHAPRDGGGDVDVSQYIAMIAMAEDLKRGEMHLEKSRNAIKEAHRKAKEQIEAQRLEHERQLAAARKEHERLVSEQARKFAKERAEFEAELERQREALVREREALAKERAAHARDREALERERAAHRRDCEVLARERATHREEAAALTARLAEHRRLMDEERKRLGAQIEAQQKQAARERSELLARIEAEQREAAAERKRIAAQLEELQRQTLEERKQAAAQLAARIEEQKRQAAEEKRRLADQLAAEKRRAAEERKRLAAQFATVAAAAPAKGRSSGPLPLATRETTPPQPVGTPAVFGSSVAGPGPLAQPTPPAPPQPVPPTPRPPKPPKPSSRSSMALRSRAIMLPVVERMRAASSGLRVRWRGFRWNRSWNTPAVAAGVLMAVGGVTLAASLASDEAPEVRTPLVSPARTPLAASTAPTIIVDSLGGGVATETDSTRATIRARPRTEEDDAPRPAAATVQEQATPDASARPRTPTRPPASAFELMGVSPIPLREGNVRLDSIARPTRDVPAPDTVPRRDSLP